MKISKIDINHLTEQDIKTLIDAEKHPTNVLRYREIINQIEQTLILSSNSYKCLVKDKVRNIWFSCSHDSNSYYFLYWINVSG